MIDHIAVYAPIYIHINRLRCSAAHGGSVREKSFIERVHFSISWLTGEVAISLSAQCLHGVQRQLHFFKLGLKYQSGLSTSQCARAMGLLG